MWCHLSCLLVSKLQSLLSAICRALTLSIVKVGKGGGTGSVDSSSSEQTVQLSCRFCSCQTCRSSNHVRQVSFCGQGDVHRVPAHCFGAYRGDHDGFSCPGLSLRVCDRAVNRGKQPKTLPIYTMHSEFLQLGLGGHAHDRLAMLAF